MAEPTVVHEGALTDATIHDIGYRRYEGTLLSDAGSWRALFWQGFRALFGVGRGAKSKVVAVFVLVVTMLPSLAMLTAASASQGMLPIRYGNLMSQQILMLVLFVAAQAPEIFSRDQQQRVLPLILTRQLTRNAYASARFVSLFLALLLLSLFPPLLLYIGEMASALDPGAAFERMGTKIWPIFAQTTITALVISGIGALFAALTPRRSYATAAIIGLFLVLAAVGEGISDLAGAGSHVAEFVDPMRALRMQARLLFDESNRQMELRPPMAVSNYVAYLAGVGVLSVALMTLRIRRVRV